MLNNGYIKKDIKKAGVPDIIAKIKLCGGALTINVDETMQWKKPTNEQIKNLHDLLCIDVEMLGE